MYGVVMFNSAKYICLGLRKDDFADLANFEHSSLEMGSVSFGTNFPWNGIRDINSK